MAQTYKMMLGTSGRQWEQLTVREDGTMMLYFHGTDRSVTTQVTLIEDGAWKGWLRSEGGSLYPGIESGKWQLMSDVRCMMSDVVETTENHVEAEVTESPIADEPIPSQQQMNLLTEVTESPITNEPIPNQPRPRRQRKQRKQRVERQEPLTIDHSPLTIDHQPSATLKAIGMVAAATVALFVIYETGLLIPLGLIGLATGGVMK